MGSNPTLSAMHLLILLGLSPKNGQIKSQFKNLSQTLIHPLGQVFFIFSFEGIFGVFKKIFPQNPAKA
jgi:hypothetical protein